MRKAFTKSRIGNPCMWISAETEARYFTQAKAWGWDHTTIILQAYYLLTGKHGVELSDNMIWCFDENLIKTI